MFPNPASDKVSIEGSVKFDEIEIVSIDGRTLLIITPSAYITEIELNSLSSGVYFIRVKSNGEFATREFIKY
jgi:hypothetical protein